eukprot:2335347-Rhodomonas_salina.4
MSGPHSSFNITGGPEHVRIAFYPCLDQNSTGELRICLYSCCARAVLIQDSRCCVIAGLGDRRLLRGAAGIVRT